jgi:hypothetical protein
MDISLKLCQLYSSEILGRKCVLKHCSGKYYSEIYNLVEIFLKVQNNTAKHKNASNDLFLCFIKFVEILQLQFRKALYRLLNKCFCIKRLIYRPITLVKF